MKYKINTYFAVLLVTIAGAFASLLIIHVAYANSFYIIVVGSEGEYAPLQELILSN